VAQIGYILLGASLVSIGGLSASLLHMFNHALAKGALFLAVMGLAMRYSELDLRGLAGAARRMPWTMSALVVAGLSLIGVPGTAGFVSKWYLVSAALDEGALGIALVAVIVAGSLMAVVYVWRIVEAAWFAPVQEPSESVQEAPAPMLAMIWLAAVANVYFGLATGLPRELATSAAVSLLGHLP
jgi:multicomponent Na+:H+ antiporter subunit D